MKEKTRCFIMGVFIGTALGISFVMAILTGLGLY